MREELEDKLFDKYPDIFADRHLPMTQTCMCWGIDCGDGWYDLIDRLCAKIQKIIDDDPALKGVYKAVQVKEKWGGLRFYMNYHHDEAEKYIGEAEEESEKTCEVCGKSGTLNDEGWISCLCDKCRNKND